MKISVIQKLTNNELVQCITELKILEATGAIDECKLRDIADASQSLLDSTIRMILREIAERWYSNTLKEG